MLEVSTDFRDYIDKYKKINSCSSEVWITLYEDNDNEKNDLFSFCALADKNILEDKYYLNSPSWDFSLENFGRISFSIEIDDKEIENVVFDDGKKYEGFEYLVCVRSFYGKYKNSVEINPEIIWYKNLVKCEDGYKEPISDKLIIKISENKIEIEREYLKDFLSAVDKVCVLVFHHIRNFYSENKVLEEVKEYKDKNYYIKFFKTEDNRYDDFNAFSSIQGKVIITPFRKPLHEDYKEITSKEEYEEFIYKFDEEIGEELKYTCNEDKLRNCFGANPEAPFFLTPIFFNYNVLEKYTKNPRNYEISDDRISFLNKWDIPFSRTEDKNISVWLGDLGRIPLEEQKYWKIYNIRPKGKMDEKFIDRQINVKWTTPSRIEQELLLKIGEFNKNFEKIYNINKIFSDLKEADKEIYNSFILPTNSSVEGYKEFLMKLTKITTESINQKEIKKKLPDEIVQNLNNNGSIKILGEFLNHFEIDNERKLETILKKVHNCRNKLAAHSGSFKEYNKLWNRESQSTLEDVIRDAEELLKDIILALDYNIKNIKNKENDRYE